jgi:hypothetical protein
LQKLEFLRRANDEPEHLAVSVVEYLAQLVRDVGGATVSCSLR